MSYSLFLCFRTQPNKFSTSTGLLKEKKTQRTLFQPLINFYIQLKNQERGPQEYINIIKTNFLCVISFVIASVATTWIYCSWLKCFALLILTLRRVIFGSYAKKKKIISFLFSSSFSWFQLLPSPLKLAQLVSTKRKFYPICLYSMSFSQFTSFGGLTSGVPEFHKFLH